MGWTLRYSKRAQKDVVLIRRAGLQSKLLPLLEILLRDPFQNPPSFEKLSGELKGKYSRRINKQHRLVYKVRKKERIVEVLQIWTHYE